MKNFNEVLEAFLVGIENNPDKNVDEIIRDVASSLGDSDKELSEECKAELDKSLQCVDELYDKIADLQQDKDEGFTRDDWFLNKINEKLNKIPRMTKGQKIKIVSTILERVKSALKEQ